MPVYFDNDKNRWRFTFNRIIAGRRTRATKLLPKGWGRSRSEKWADGETARLYALASGVERPEPTIGAAVALYLEHRVPRLRNGKKVARDLAHLIDYIDGRPISQMPAVATEYIKANPDLSDGTLHNRLAYLKAAGRYAWKKHKLTPHDPTSGMDIPRPKNAREVQIPVQRVHELLDALSAIDREAGALFTLAFRTGTRWVKGIWPRKPEDVMLAGRDVWLDVGLTKNGQKRMKWVHPDARWALTFLPFTKSAETYYDRFRAARHAVGLPDLWAHDMRHVLATDIRKRGGSLEDVGAALDHDSRAASERYAHITPAQIKRVLSGVKGGRKMHTKGKKKAA